MRYVALALAAAVLLAAWVIGFVMGGVAEIRAAEDRE